MKRGTCMAIQGMLTAAVAFLSGKLGTLFSVLCILLGVMVLDYLSGMAASKVEAIDHPGDNHYGWSSKKGAKGILKKVGYLCVVSVAVVIDYIMTKTSGTLGFAMPAKTLFSLLVAVWYLLNELLSIIENAGRMGAPIPEWLTKYIAVLKDKIDNHDDEEKKK